MASRLAATALRAARRGPAAGAAAGPTAGLPAAPSAARRCLSSTPPGRGGGTGGGPQLAVLPPNLRIDPRSTCSPFYGLERVGGGGVDNDSDHAEAAAADEQFDSADAESESESESGSESDTDDVGYHDADDADDTDEVLYDLSTRLDPQYAVPLPERLRVPVLRLSTAEEVGTLHLDPSVFGMDPIRADLLHRVVIYQRNKKRGRRKAKTKTVSEVSGSGRKVRAQKGSGMARAGHSRPAHWRGGAKAHGPKGSIQDYTTRLNKKVRRLGLVHAFSQKLKEGNLVLVGDLVLDTHKTGRLAAVLDRYDIGGEYGASAFVLDSDEVGRRDGGEENEHELGGGSGSGSRGGGGDEREDGVVTPSARIGGINIQFRVAARNLHKVKLANQLGANVYDILKHEKLVLTLPALRALEERLG